MFPLSVLPALPPFRLHRCRPRRALLASPRPHPPRPRGTRGRFGRIASGPTPRRRAGATGMDARTTRWSARRRRRPPADTTSSWCFLRRLPRRPRRLPACSAAWGRDASGCSWSRRGSWTSGAGSTHGVAGESGSACEVARGTSRATRRLRDGTIDLLISTPETAAALQRRSALHGEGVTAVVLAWPEMWDDEDAASPLMQDLKDAQRLVMTSSPERAAGLVERYARRALTLGTAGADASPVGPVRTVDRAVEPARSGARASWSSCWIPSRCVIWTVDRGPHEAIAAAAALRPARCARRDGRCPSGRHDHRVRPARSRAPAPARRSRASWCCSFRPAPEGYVDRVAAPRRPLRLPGALEAATTAAAARRAAILRALEAGAPERALLTLAPLFERHDPALVAAALFELWTGAAGATAPAALPDIPATSRLYVGVGKKDGATVNDLGGGADEGTSVSSGTRSAGSSCGMRSRWSRCLRRTPSGSPRP